MTACICGDYVPAIQLFRPLAAKGNARAQHRIGVMYHKSEGVARNSVRVSARSSLVAAHGDGDAKAKLAEVSKEMTSDELALARRWRGLARRRITGIASIG
jgi:TPR repeat protein